MKTVGLPKSMWTLLRPSTRSYMASSLKKISPSNLRGSGKLDPGSAQRDETKVDVHGVFVTGGIGARSLALC